MEPNPLRMIHDLKGAPLSVVLTLAILRRPANGIELSRYTGYDQDTITKTLRKLEDPFLFGLLVRVKHGWALAENAQIPLFFNQKSENLGLISTTTINKLTNSNQDDSSSSPKKIRKSRIFSDEEKPRWDALAKGGIFYNDRTAALVKLQHATPEYITAKIAEFKERKLRLPHNAGLLLLAIENNEPIIEAVPESETVVNYAGGAFADSIGGYDEEEIQERKQQEERDIRRYCEIIAALDTATGNELKALRSEKDKLIHGPLRYVSAGKIERTMASYVSTATGN